jgi:asparagine synthase (glutamine-hydrolysing)
VCGIVGFLGVKAFSDIDSLTSVLRRMTDRLITRGPDSEGHWLDTNDQIGLGHRRLSIVDLSPAGHQPMTSPSGRYVAVFNGEIYNHVELRERLVSKAGGSPTWRGQSDTETILACFDVWGVEHTVRSCVGMFAIAVWDRQTKELTLVRDRLGEKPLYYGWQGAGNAATFMFCSDLIALKAHPSFEGRIDRSAITLLLRHSYIPAPHSIYEDIHKLEPGEILVVSLSSREPKTRLYWSLNEAVARGFTEPFEGSPKDAVDTLEALLSVSIRRQMVADVPLGAFLSGGVDSSTVVALMQTQARRPVKTFTIGFDERGYDEAVHAKVVARHLGTEHTELYVPAYQALEVVPRLAALYSEPFSDSSQIPTYLLSKLAQQHVKVALSGDAGDELFAGYSRYIWTDRLWSRISRCPVSLRRMAAAGIVSVSPAAWDGVLRGVRPLLPQRLRVSSLGDRLHKGARVLASQTQDDLYLSVISHWMHPTDIVLGGKEPPTRLKSSQFNHLTGIEKMMALDTVTYLPDDILVKVDRAAMGASLETRVPMLDHHIVEFAWRLPLNYKLRAFTSKWVLRQLLYRYVPKVLIERPKMGFGVPLDTWLKTSLKDWAEALLNEDRLRREGFFDPAPIRQKWVEHLSGRRNWQGHLWDVLMFQAWLEASRG